MRNVMVDLETLGTVPGCAILSIGAINFNVDGVGTETFYGVISLESCVEAFLTVDPKTQKWWSEQSEDARKVLMEAEKGGTPLNRTLEYFNNYLRRIGNDVKVWGNGADFDNAILQVAYDAVKVKPAWRFTHNRCYRTLKNLMPTVPLPERTGTYHHALDDAKTQAAHAVQLMRRLSSGVTSPDMADLAAKYMDYGLRPPEDLTDAATVAKDVRCLAASVMSQA